MGCTSSRSSDTGFETTKQKNDCVLNSTCPIIEIKDTFDLDTNTIQSSTNKNQLIKESQYKNKNIERTHRILRLGEPTGIFEKPFKGSNRKKIGYNTNYSFNSHTFDGDLDSIFDIDDYLSIDSIYVISPCGSEDSIHVISPCGSEDTACGSGTEEPNESQLGFGSRYNPPCSLRTEPIPTE